MKTECPDCGNRIYVGTVIDVLVIEGDDRWTRIYYYKVCEKRFTGMQVEPE